MTQVSTELSVAQPNDPIVARGSQRRLAGASLILPRAQFDLAVSEDRGRIASFGAASGIYPAGQVFMIVGEPGYRVWTVGTGADNPAIAAASHARTVVLPSGATITLAADANAVLPVSGPPDGAAGAPGDLALDVPGNARYIKVDATTWSASAAIFPTGSLTVAGVPAWAAGTTYAQAQRVVSPDGRVITAHAAHVSGLQFDARSWLYPTDDGSTLFDFTQLPDMPLVGVYPTKGRLYNFGTRPAQYDKWVVKDGLFQENPANPSTEVIYFEGELSNPGLLVQHMWCVADVAPNPADGNGITFILNTLDVDVTGGTPVGSGIHWGMLPRIGTNYDGLWGSEPFPLGFGGVSNGPTHVPVQQPRGRTMRWDITVDTRTGQMTGYIDGKVAMQYTDVNVIGAIRHRAIFEILGPNFKVREFGLSPHMPLWATNGDARPLRLTGNDNTAITALTGSYQRLHQFNVGYDCGGAVSASWNPFVNCSAGQVFIELGPADPTEFAAYIATVALPQVVAEAGTNCRVAFAGWQRGTPGTTKALGIWARSTGTATVRQDSYGNNVGGPRWQHADYRSSVNA